MAGGGEFEDYTARHPVRTGSDRVFGLVFSVAFVLVALSPLRHGGGPRWWAGAVAGAFALVALVRPGLLAPLNRIWFQIGLVLNRVVSPVVMGLLFYLAITPSGWLMRARGGDPLRLKRDPSAGSWWIERRPPGPDAASMRRQF